MKQRVDKKDCEVKMDGEGERERERDGQTMKRWRKGEGNL